MFVHACPHVWSPFFPVVSPSRFMSTPHLQVTPWNSPSPAHRYMTFRPAEGSFFDPCMHPQKNGIDGGFDHPQKSGIEETSWASYPTRAMQCLEAKLRYSCFGNCDETTHMTDGQVGVTDCQNWTSWYYKWPNLRVQRERIFGPFHFSLQLFLWNDFWFQKQQQQQNHMFISRQVHIFVGCFLQHLEKKQLFRHSYPWWHAWNLACGSRARCLTSSFHVLGIFWGQTCRKP